MTNSIQDISQAQVIIVIGSNTTEAHPVLSLQIKKAVRQNGAKLILIDPRQIELANFAALHIQQKPGSDVAILNAMAQVIIAEGLVNEPFVRARTEGFELLAAAVADWTPERAAQIAGISPDQIVMAARWYAQAPAASIFWAMGITQHTTGTDNVKALSNLALLTGQIGRPGTGLNPLRGQNNVQGACDMGGLPNVFPAYQPVINEAVRQKFATAWNLPLERFSSKVGLTVTEIIHGISAGKIKAMVIMGENPMLSDPNLNHVRQALEELSFLVVIDIFLNETAQMADVVLPALSFAEKSGTFTSTERRVHLIRPALPPLGEAHPDWQILTDLANRLGANWYYESPAEIFAEMAKVTPSYAGISHERLEKEGGIQWPCPTPEHAGTPILHTEKFARGLGLFCPVDYRSPAETADEKYPFILTTGRILFHWHGGTLSRRSAGLESIAPEAEVEINPQDALKYQLETGQPVQVSSRRGSVIALAKITPRSPEGMIFMTFHFAESATNLLTIDAVDPTAKIPEYKVCAVKIEKHVP